MIKADRTYLGLLLLTIVVCLAYISGVLFYTTQDGFNFGSGYDIFAMTVIALSFVFALILPLGRTENARHKIAISSYPTKKLLPVSDDNLAEDEAMTEETTEGTALANLSLPWELRWRPGIRVITAPLVVSSIYILPICFFFVAIWRGWIEDPSASEWQGLAIVGVYFGIFLFVTTLLIAWFTRKRMVVTKDGIARIKFGRTRIISWQEARLFLKTGYSKQIYYELSSATTIIRWREDWTNGSLKINFTDEDIANINDLVVACTGLPLVEPAPK